MAKLKIHISEEYTRLRQKDQNRYCLKHMD